MNCTHARKLYAAYWDDETTQAEREWLEGHFHSCATCRREYEQYARTIELLGSLPRVEPSPELPERVLQRVKRSESIPDRLPVGRPIWVPVASAVAAAALIAVTIAGPWLGSRHESPVATQLVPSGPVTQPVLVQVPTSPAGTSDAAGAKAHVELALAPVDSLFDHSEDVEFILDPVTLHRGRASVNRTSAHPDEKAVITF